MMQLCELSAAITALANLMARCCSSEELEIWAAAFTQLGDTLILLSLQAGYEKPSSQ